MFASPVTPIPLLEFITFLTGVTQLFMKSGYNLIPEMSCIQSTAQAVTVQNQLLLINVNIKNDYFWNISEKYGGKRRLKYSFGKR